MPRCARGYNKALQICECFAKARTRFRMQPPFASIFLPWILFSIWLNASEQPLINVRMPFSQVGFCIAKGVNDKLRSLKLCKIASRNVSLNKVRSSLFIERRNNIAPDYESLP